MTAIPDESPTELVRKFEPLGRYLGEKLGMKIEFVATTDYAATVEALIGRKVDLAWFGGFTFVQANARSKGMITPLVQRDEDQRFRSVFVTGTKSDIKSLDDLADLATDELVQKKRVDQRRRRDAQEDKGGILAEYSLTEEQGNEIIMAARAHWFEDEVVSEGDADAVPSQ